MPYFIRNILHSPHTNDLIKLWFCGENRFNTWISLNFMNFCTGFNFGTGSNPRHDWAVISLTLNTNIRIQILN